MSLPIPKMAQKNHPHTVCLFLRKNKIAITLNKFVRQSLIVFFCMMFQILKKNTNFSHFSTRFESVFDKNFIAIPNKISIQDVNKFRNFFSLRGKISSRF